MLMYEVEFGDRRVPKITSTIADVTCDVGSTGGGGMAGRGWGGKHTWTLQASSIFISDAQEANRGFYFKEAFNIAAYSGQRNREGAINREL